MLTVTQIELNTMEISAFVDHSSNSLLFSMNCTLFCLLCECI